LPALPPSVLPLSVLPLPALPPSVLPLSVLPLPALPPSVLPLPVFPLPALPPSVFPLPALPPSVLPIAELMEVVKTHELISIVDGAHLPGMLDVDYGALGMDFMSAAGHKWQCGPGSTGIMIVRNKIRASNPLPLPAWYPVHTSAYGTAARGSYDIAQRITQCGSLHTPMFDALVAASEMWDELGRKKVETYILTLSSYLKERIAERWGVQALYSPKDDARLLTGLTCFNPFRNPDDIMSQEKSTQFVARMLGEYGFVIRNVNFEVQGAAAEHWGVRVSTHLWHDADDIDRLVESMDALSRAMA